MFTLGQINELVLKGHSYISKIGIKIINDKECKSFSVLENHFYSFINLLEVIEERKDFDYTDTKFQELVLRLYSKVNNECVYYNSRFVDIEGYPFDTSINIDLSNYVTIEFLFSVISSVIANSVAKSIINITDNSTPLVIDWQYDIAPNEDGTPSGKTFRERHGKFGFIHSAKWKNNNTNKFEKTDAYTLEEEVDINNEIMLVTINAFDIPFKFTII